ncbi:MAG: hypothetical protein DMG36_25590 [Acidobacteria bacterium]|nr:MAG: hypothetical protein DMG36_25590 [Acidobacteriota bacterium]
MTRRFAFIGRAPFTNTPFLSRVHRFGQRKEMVPVLLALAKEVIPDCLTYGDEIGSNEQAVCHGRKGKPN